MCGVSRKSYPNFFKVADKIWTLRIFFQSCQQIKQQSVQMLAWISSDCLSRFLLSATSESTSLWTGLWSSGELGRGKREKACRQTLGTAVPRHRLCIRSWCKILLARTLTVDRSDWHRLFGRHIARDPKTVKLAGLSLRAGGPGISPGYSEHDPRLLSSLN